MGCVVEPPKNFLGFALYFASTLALIFLGETFLHPLFELRTSRPHEGGWRRR